MSPLSIPPKGPWLLSCLRNLDPDCHWLQGLEWGLTSHQTMYLEIPSARSFPHSCLFQLRLWVITWQTKSYSWSSRNVQRLRNRRKAGIRFPGTELSQTLESWHCCVKIMSITGIVMKSKNMEPHSHVCGELGMFSILFLWVYTVGVWITLFIKTFKNLMGV